MSAVHERQVILAAGKARVRNRTIAQDRISGRPLTSLSAKRLPILAVYIHDEDVITATSSARPLKRIVRLVFEMFIRLDTDDIEAEIDLAALQIENALDLDLTLGGAGGLETLTLLRSEMDFSESDQGIAALRVIYQGVYWTDVRPGVASPLNDLSTLNAQFDATDPQNGLVDAEARIQHLET